MPPAMRARRSSGHGARFAGEQRVQRLVAEGARLAAFLCQRDGAAEMKGGRVVAAGGAGGPSRLVVQPRLPSGIAMAQFDIIGGVRVVAHGLRPVALAGRFPRELLLLRRRAQFDLRGAGAQRHQDERQDEARPDVQECGHGATVAYGKGRTFAQNARIGAFL